jgi:hypothetical protein
MRTQRSKSNPRADSARNCWTCGLFTQSQPHNFTIERHKSDICIPVAHSTANILLCLRSRQLLVGESASVSENRRGARHRDVNVHGPGRQEGSGIFRSLDGEGGWVVDRLADRDVPPVDELELGHGVGVARRHVVVVVAVVVGRRAAGGLFGEVVWL